MADSTTPTTTQDGKPAGMRELGLTSGQSHEFLILCPVKQGGAERMRKKTAAFPPDHFKSIDKIGTVHDFRYAFLDNDTKFMFASTYDGDFVQYIKDFSTIIPAQIDALFEECEGYPGVKTPAVWDYFAKYQIESIVFYSAYPQASVRDVLKGQKVLQAFEALLDQAQS